VNRGVAAPTAGCLDAEAAAAWIDGAMSADARARAEAHVADCGRCQALIATVLAAEDAASKTPQIPAPVWRRWLPWTAPLAAAAVVLIAVVVWTNGPRDSNLPKQQAARDVPATVAQAREPVVPDRAVPPQRQGPPREAETPSPVAPRREAFGSAGSNTASADRGPLSNTASAEKADAGADATTAQPQSGSLAKVDELVVTPAAPAPPARSRVLQRSPQALADQVNPAITDIVSPDGSVRWRIRNRTAVERSIDGGQTWTAAPVGGVTTLTAGAAPTVTVCWVVGLEGTVLVTSDGATWTRRTVTPPVDLVGVTAADALVATVTAADGRRFATADGGITWTPSSGR
jgi:hypothetical protein